jgi:hypothetical protein
MTRAPGTILVGFSNRSGSARRPEFSDLLEQLLPKNRQSPLPAIELFASISESAVGRSLRRENPAVFGYVRRLFELRNALAHRGEVPDPSEVKGLMVAARETFVWLATW